MEIFTISNLCILHVFAFPFLKQNFVAWDLLALFSPCVKHAMYSFNLPYVSILVNNAEKVSLFCHYDLWLVTQKRSYMMWG